MYLDDGREIYESDKYPWYYIDANTGAWCDENGNYIGGNSDDGDKPGGSTKAIGLDNKLVYVSKTGKQYYPHKTKSATILMTIIEAKRKNYKASVVYQKYLAKEFHKQARRK